MTATSAELAHRMWPRCFSWPASHGPTSLSHGAALVKLFAYLGSAGPPALLAELGLEDFRDVRFCMWSNADWCGDAEETKSTSGMLLKLLNRTQGTGCRSVGRPPPGLHVFFDRRGGDRGGGLQH